MKPSALSPLEQSQLAAAIANVLACEISDVEDINVMLLIISAVKDNLMFYCQSLKDEKKTVSK